jgi:cytosol aminopeptidase family protein
MEGPITAETPLQIVCLFKHKESGDKMLATAVDLDKDLHGAISSLRNRGEFVGDALETLLIVPPAGTIRPKLLLLIGIGDESSLSLERMEAVGRVAVREAARLGASKIAFAPLIRDQGNSQFGTGDIGRYVIRGVLSAYDTDRRLQKEGLAKPYNLEEWSEEAGPAYFDDTVAGAKKAISDAKATISERSNKPLEKQ